MSDFQEVLGAVVVGGMLVLAGHYAIEGRGAKAFQAVGLAACWLLGMAFHLAATR